MITAVDRSRDYPCQTYTVIGILAVLMVFCFQIISLIRIHDSTPEHMLRLASVPLQPSPGFDGQFYLALAKDPFLLNGAERHLDSPVLRARRIGFPLASWLFAPVGAPPAYRLLMTESAFFILLMLITVRSSRKAQLPPLILVAIAFLLPFILSMEFVTSELPTAVLILSAIHMQTRSKNHTASMLLGVACLFKETAVLAVLAFFIDAIINRKHRDAMVALSSLIPFGIWCLYLYMRFSDGSLWGGLLQNLCFLPGMGLFTGLLEASLKLVNHPFTAKPAALLISSLLYFCGAVIAIHLIRKKRTPARLIAVGGAILVFQLRYGGAAQTYNEIFNFGRQLFLLAVGLLAVLLEENSLLSQWERKLLLAWIAIGGILGFSWWFYQLIR